MSYLISLNLPLWVSFIPLVIALYLASKYYKWKAKYYEAKHEAQSELLAVKANLQKRFDDFVAVSDRIIERNDKQIAKDAEIIRNLNIEAVERESLIEQLNKQITQLNDTNTFQSSEIQLNDAVCENLRLYIEQLNKKNKELDLLADFNETLANTYKHLSDRKQNIIKQLQADLAAAIAVINRTKRATKQWNKHELKKSGEAVQKAVENLQSEAVVYDALGVPRITQADQSEDFNARNIQQLSNEVVRGVKEQAEAIRNELQADKVDLSTLGVGDRVKFRNGGIDTVERVSNDNSSSMPYRVKCEINHVRFYEPNGACPMIMDGENPYDIIQIIKKSDV